MDLVSVATLLAKPAATRLVKHLAEILSRNNEQLRRDREDLSLEWGAEVKRALPQVVAYLDARVDDLDAKLAKVFEDPQFGRIFANFTFEAAREAIDERRNMIAHAAVGIVDPDISVERKARVERTLRSLDPNDVLTLYGAKLVPGTVAAGERCARALLGLPSTDVLLSAGCLRLEVSGGGAGEGASAGLRITQLGDDVLRVLRSFIATRHPPFDVPGRERRPNDRSEEQARLALHALLGLHEFSVEATRRSFRASRTYDHDVLVTPMRGFLRFYIHEAATWKPELEALTVVCQSSEIQLELHMQPYTPSEGAPYDLLRAVFSGPHDLLRYFAEDCEAVWT
jgi:hypothetical protein